MALLRTVALGLASAATLSAQSPVSLIPARLTPRYAVVDLGVATGSSPTGLSEGGYVSGIYFNAAGERRAFLWRNGVASDLGTLGGIAQALAVNDTGVAVGYSVDAQGRQRAIRVQNGVMTALPTLHGGLHANANDINDAGAIAGMSQLQQGNDMLQRAALWQGGTVRDLGTFGGEFSEANAINANGQVVGWAWYPLPTRRQRAFLWSASTGLIDLGSLAGSTSVAADLNDRAEVVGSSPADPVTGASHAFLWTAASGMVDLGVPAGASESYAAAINNAGQIIGNALFFDPVNCFRFEPLLWERGQLRILNELIDPASGWVLASASDIDDLGRIAATARRPSGSYRAVVLVPVDPPL